MRGLPERHAAYDLKLKTFQRCDFGGMIRQQLYTTQAQVMKYLRADSVIAVYAVAGHETDAVRAVQILLSLGTCLIVYLLGQALVGRRGGILAAAIYATMPAAIGYPTCALGHPQ